MSLASHLDKTTSPRLYALRLAVLQTFVSTALFFVFILAIILFQFNREILHEKESVKIQFETFLERFEENRDFTARGIEKLRSNVYGVRIFLLDTSLVSNKNKGKIRSLREHSDPSLANTKLPRFENLKSFETWLENEFYIHAEAEIKGRSLYKNIYLGLKFRTIFNQSTKAMIPEMLLALIFLFLGGNVTFWFIRSFSQRSQQKVQHLIEANEKLSLFSIHNPNPVFRINESGEIEYANPSALDTFGQVDAIREKVEKAFDEMKENFKSFLYTEKQKIAYIQIGQSYFRFLFRSKPNLKIILVYGRDVSREIRQQESLTSVNKELEEKVRIRTQELQIQYEMDSSTGLFNRYRLNHDLPSNPLEGELLLIEISNYANVESAFGLDEANLFVARVARLIEKNIEKTHIIYRYSQDRLALIIPEDIDNLQAMAHELREIGQKEFVQIKDYQLYPVLYFGLLSLKERGNKLLNAEIALKQAISRESLDGVCVYDKSLTRSRHAYVESFLWIQKVQQAIEDDEVQAVFQGIVNNKTKTIEKYEALMRLVQDGEMISPGRFFPAIKGSPLMHKLNMSMFRKVVATMSEHPGILVNFNLTQEDLVHRSLPDIISSNLQKYNIQPQQLTFEVVESVTLDAEGSILNNLQALKKAGHKLAIDDFGADQANFGKLLDLDVDVIKIDGTFIKVLDSNISAFTIAQTITHLAHTMGAMVVAEFVENESIQERVQELGIEYSQGYLYSKPSELKKNT